MAAETVQTLELLARKVEEETTSQLTLVTVVSLEGKTIEQYASSLFNQWGIGQKETNNGLLLLVAPNERRVRIEVGYGLEDLLPDSLCGELLDEFVVSEFKKGDVNRGAERGMEELASILLRYPKAARGVKGSGPLFVRTPQRDAMTGLIVQSLAVAVVFLLGLLAVRKRSFSTQKFIVMTIILLVMGSVATLLVMRTATKTNPLLYFGGTSGTMTLGVMGQNFRRYRRYGPHGCSKCGTQLVMLDEKADDEKITEVQRLEEAMGSVDYDVWYCPACLHEDTERYVLLFSGFQDCPYCKACLFKEGWQRIVVPATTNSSGTAEVEGQCVSCKHKRVRTVFLPRIVKSTLSGSSSGGGGSSFGGGSSGGGGASRSW